MSEYIHKSHNVTVLMSQIVLPAKYHKAIFYSHIAEVLKDICLEIEQRY
ncbi:transposase (fragment) [Xenorhabdus bovienii str. kraussei Quebec]|uniref:Transposase n=1 Tax=Xenorhabdus bovienii str. kraussei Quebec TaxID=1398203 RepID=A0A077P430_XENBV